MSHTFLQYRLLNELTRTPGVSQRGLARHLGCSLGKTNYCLRELMRAGLVRTNGANGDGKANGAYELTCEGTKELRRLALECLEQKRKEYEELQQAVKELNVDDQA